MLLAVHSGACHCQMPVQRTVYIYDVVTVQCVQVRIRDYSFRITWACDLDKRYARRAARDVFFIVRVRGVTVDQWKFRNRKQVRMLVTVAAL